MRTSLFKQKKVHFGYSKSNDHTTYEVFMALVANCLISRIALGALFLKETPYNLLLM
jgi:hypothetical protein